MRLLICLALVLGLVSLWPSSVLAAQSSPPIIFDSFTGVYHLSRDSRGLSLLTSEEAIVAEFPNGGYSGISRQIPQTYQGHSVQVQVLSVTDASGDSIPYKTASQNGNLVITTGDPSITLYGSQIFHITYHTTGVIDLAKGSDQFILDVNGRGWSQSFGSVSATLYIPDSFQAKLTDQPSCYLALNNLTSASCSLSSKQTSQGRQINAESHNLAANQTLVLKMSFAPTTFTNKHQSWLKPALIITAVILVVLVLAGILIDSLAKPAKNL